MPVNEHQKNTFVNKNQRKQTKMHYKSSPTELASYLKYSPMAQKETKFHRQVHLKGIG